MATRPEDVSPAERQQAGKRWTGFVKKAPKAADIAAKGSSGIRYFTDASGATILENAHGRFRLDKLTGRYEPDNG